MVDDDHSDMSYSGHVGRSHSGSLSNYGYPPESYAYDDEVYPRGRGYHHHRRHSSSSSLGRPIMQGGSAPYYSTVPSNAIAIPGTVGSGYGGTYGYDGMGTSPYGHTGTSPYGVGPASYPIQPGMFPGSGSTVIIEQSRSSRHKHHKYGSGHKHHSRRHRTYSDASYPLVPGYASSSYY